jgi:hypothetical protein
MPGISRPNKLNLIMTKSGVLKPGKEKPVFFILVFSLLLFFLLNFPVIYGQTAQTTATAASVEKAGTQWYLITLGGQKIGYIKESGQKVKENGQWFYKSYSESKMAFNRLGKKAEITSKAEYLETEDGQLKKVLSETVMSSEPIKVEALVEEGKIVLKTTASGRTFSRDLPFSGQLFGPEGISQLSQARLKQPGDKVEYRTLLAELSQVVTGERWLAGEEEIDFRGEKIKTRKIEEKTSGVGSTRQVWIDEAGHEIKSVESSPFGDLIVIASTEEEVRKGVEGLSISEDQYQVSLVKSNVRLPQARTLNRLVIKIEKKKPEGGWPDLSHDYQRIISQTAETTLLAVSQVNLKSPAGKKLSKEESERYLKANAYLDSDDPGIKKVAAEVAGPVKDPYDKAWRLRNWVATNMTFDLGIVFAPASEVIKNKRGTCAGYASLLASLLRAAGIPSRYLMGLVYVNGVWGGHAWTEAWLSDRWVPLDAAVPGPGVADAARLVVAAGGLDEGLGESLMAAQKIFGQVDIKIQDYSFDGHRYRVEPGQPLYEIRDGIYTNRGLQISLKAPAGYSFYDTDKVWPDKTVVALKGPAGETVKLTQEGWFPAADLDQYLVSQLKKMVKDGRLVYLPVWEKKRPAVISADKSVAGIINGVDLFVMSAEGQNSEQLLSEVLKHLTCQLVIK